MNLQKSICLTIIAVAAIAAIATVAIFNVVAVLVIAVAPFLTFVGLAILRSATSAVRLDEYTTPDGYGCNRDTVCAVYRAPNSTERSVATFSCAAAASEFLDELEGAGYDVDGAGLGLFHTDSIEEALEESDDEIEHEAELAAETVMNADNETTAAPHSNGDAKPAETAVQVA